MNQNNQDILYDLGSEKLSEEKDYYIYVPNNIENNSTEAIIFYPGAGGYKNDDIAIREYIAGNPNKIVIINKSPNGGSSGDYSNFGSEIINELNTIQNNSNVTITDVDVLGHSLGESYAFRAAEVLNNNGYHADNVVIVGGASNTSEFKLSDSEANNYANNDTSVLIFNEYERSAGVANNLKILTDKGVDVGFVYGEGYDYYNGFSQRHSTLKKEPIRNDLFDFLDGKVEKLDDNRTLSYHFSYYDHENNQWVDNVSEDEFSNMYHRRQSTGGNNQYKLIDDTYGYLKKIGNINYNNLGYSSESITSEEKYVVEQMNGLRKKVSDTHFLDSLNSKVGNLSTDNPVLSYENRLLSSYFKSTGNLLEKAAYLTDAIVNVAFIMNQVDTNLSQTADELLNGDGLTAKNLSSGNLSTNSYNLSPMLMQNLNRGYKLNIGKYSENKPAGFELRLSNKIYSLNDFDSAYAREKWGYNSEQAREAFIAVCINESDKTPDGMLAVTSVALNRCENDNWSSYYTKSDQYGTTDGTKPFDQMFVNNGRQYSVISSGSYERYLPSVVGIDKINEHLAGYGTSYEELAAVAEDALSGGIRNNYYTGFRASLPEYSGAKIDPNNYATNVFRYENYQKDLDLANSERQKLTPMSLAGTSYTGRDSIMVPSEYVSSGNSAAVVSSKPLISFETRTPTGNNDNSLLLVGSKLSRDDAVITPIESSTTVDPLPSAKIPTPTPVKPVVSVEAVSAPLDQTVTVTEPTDSYVAHPANDIISTPAVEQPVVVDDIQSVDSSPSFSPLDQTITVTEPTDSYVAPSVNDITSTPRVEQSVVVDDIQPVDSSPSISMQPSSSPDISIPHVTDDSLNIEVSEEGMIDSSSSSISNTPNTTQERPSSSGSNSHLRNIGLATAGAAAIGGLAYTGSKTIKKIKSNQSIDDEEDDETEEGDEK